MMGFLELVKKRYSCRQYAATPVPRESIERCLEAARLAPSACNSQPWHFIVVDEPGLKQELARQAFSGIYSIFSFAQEAPVLVALVREWSTCAAILGGAFRGISYGLIDMGIAGEHFALQAAEEGLGTCWIGWFNERAVKKALNIPLAKRVDILFTLGYARETQEGAAREKKRKSLGQMREYR